MNEMMLSTKDRKPKEKPKRNSRAEKYIPGMKPSLQGSIAGMSRQSKEPMSSKTEQLKQSSRVEQKLEKKKKA